MKEAIENIKKFRELKNMTREDLADRLEMSLSGYSKLERGEVELTVNKLYRIAEILEISVSQILNFDASQIFNVSKGEENILFLNHKNIEFDESFGCIHQKPNSYGSIQEP